MIDNGSKKAVITVNSKGITIGEDAFKSMLSVVNNMLDSPVIVDRVDRHKIDFRKIPSEEVANVRKALQDLFNGGLSGNGLSLGDTPLQKDFSDSGKALDTEVSLDSLKIVPKKSHIITNNDHRVISSICDKYGGVKDPAAIGYRSVLRQQNSGIIVKDIPSDNLDDFISSLRRRLGNDFNVTTDNKAPMADIEEYRPSIL